jgi:Bacterial Ig domain
MKYLGTIIENIYDYSYSIIYPNLEMQTNQYSFRIVSSNQRASRLFVIVPTIAVILAGTLGVFLDITAQDEKVEESGTLNKEGNSFILLKTDKDSYIQGDNIQISGALKNATTRAGLPNQTVIIEAFTDSTTIYKSYAITNNEGSFFSSFRAQNTGDIRIAANSSSSDAIVTIPVKSPIDGISIGIVLILIIAPIVGFLFIPPRHRIWSIVLAGGSVGFGLYYLNAVASLGQVLTAALSTALFAPIGTEIFDYLSKRREGESLRESTVAEYRNQNLKDEVKALTKIYEELCQHQSVFQLANYDDFSVRLSSKEYENQSIVGTMASLPGLRINMYYRYVNLYNACLDYKFSKKGNIKNIENFNNYFKSFKQAYSELETILYVNIIYSIAEIHHKFLSFPTVTLPMRISRPLYWHLLVSKALEGNVLSEKGIDFVYLIENEIQELPEQIKDRKTNLINARQRKRLWHDKKLGDYKYEDENIIERFSTLEGNHKSTASNAKAIEYETRKKQAKDVYELLRIMKKGDLYEDGIAYRFMTYLGKEFRDKYNRLENAASNLRLLNLMAYPQSKLGFSNEKIKIQLTGSSSDSIHLFFDIRTMPAHGELCLGLDGLVTYTPDSWYAGEDSFTFVVTDCTITSDPAQVSIRILPGNKSGPIISAPSVMPSTLGPEETKITAKAHITHNKGVASATIGIREKGKPEDDCTFDNLHLLQGDQKNGVWSSTVTVDDDHPDGEYEAMFYATDEANNRATGPSVNFTLRRNQKE